MKRSAASAGHQLPLDVDGGSSTEDELLVDVDDGSICLPCGPSNLHEVLTVVRSMASSIHRQSSSEGATLRRWTSHDLVLTTSYTGMQTAEFALREIQTGLGLPKSNVIYYSATEHDLKVQKFSMENSHGRPRHLFVDVTDRIPDRTLRESLQKFLDDQVQLWSDTYAEYRLKGISKKKVLEIKFDLSNQVVNKLRQELHRIEFGPYAWCEIHKSQCPISPRMDPDLQALDWLEVGGSECTPFSTMNIKSGRWCHHSTLATLVYLHSVCFFEPTRFMHECVKHFDFAMMAHLLCDEADALKCPWALSPISGGPSPHYHAQCETFSPVQLGIPTSRPRLYSCFVLLPFVRARQHHSEFSSLFFREMAVDLGVYFVASNQALLDLGEDVGINSLRGSEYGRLEAYELLAKRFKFYDEVEGWQRDHVLAKVDQLSTFEKKLHVDVVPTLCRNTRLFDLVGQRTVSVAESWLINGFPRPGPWISSSLSCSFPHV